MLAKVNRLQKNKDFSKVFKSGKSFFSGNLSVRVESGDRIKSPRFGFVVSNKIEKRATRRNALKRRLRAATRQIWPEFAKPFNAVVVVKQNYAWPYQYSIIETDLVDCLKRAGVLKSEKE